jgi:hypothetical protein
MSFSAIKFGWGPIGKDEEHDTPGTRAAKRAAGDRVEILIDAGFGYGAPTRARIRVARKLEEIGIYWLEEPSSPTSSRPTPAGRTARAAAARLVEDLAGLGAVAGGAVGALRGGQVQQYAARDVRPQPQRLQRGDDGVATEDGIQPRQARRGNAPGCGNLNAVLENAHFQEYCVAQTPINLELTRERLPIVDGWVDVPDKPGLGIELDPEILERYAVGPAVGGA